MHGSGVMNAVWVGRAAPGREELLGGVEAPAGEDLEFYEEVLVVRGTLPGDGWPRDPDDGAGVVAGGGRTLREELRQRASLASHQAATCAARLGWGRLEGENRLMDRPGPVYGIMEVEPFWTLPLAMALGERGLTAASPIRTQEGTLVGFAEWETDSMRRPIGVSVREISRGRGLGAC